MINDTPSKRCTKCGAAYPATTEFFHRSTPMRDGLSYYCKSCVLGHPIEGDRRVRHSDTYSILGAIELPECATALNQREKWIRASAYIETEGSIQLKRNKQAHGFTYQLRCTCSSTTPELCVWMLREFGGSVSWTDKPNGLKRKWEWFLSSKASESFLTGILPFLLIKRRQAELMLDLRKLQNLPQKHGTQEEKEKLYSPFWREMKRLNGSNRS